MRTPTIMGNWLSSALIRNSFSLFFKKTLIPTYNIIPANKARINIGSKKLTII